MAPNGVNGYTQTVLCSLDDFLKEEYDFLILGGGTAGLVLANRLTENPDVRVGVLEAGKNKLGDPLVETPLLFTQMLGNNEYDWAFKTAPQKHAGQVVAQHPRGKMLGGSSGINYMVYVRGSEADYNDWEALGNPGWGYKDCVPYFRKHQTLDPTDSLSNADHEWMPHTRDLHGATGPIHTSFNTLRMPLENSFFRAVDEISNFTNKPTDNFQGDHLGAHSTMRSVDATKGKRSYAANGYLEPILDRKNLKVLTEALVTMLVLDGNTVRGAKFLHSGRELLILAKETILSCGSYKSPQVLELSGIGDPSILRSAGVDCKIEAPEVGWGLQDHIMCISMFKALDPKESLDSITPDMLAAAQDEYAKHGTGLFASVTTGMGFVPYSALVTPEQLQETLDSLDSTETRSAFHRQQLQRLKLNYKDPKSSNLHIVLFCLTANLDGIEDQSKLFEKHPDGPGISICCAVENPASRGHVHITSADPAQQPEIDPGYLSHPADRSLLAAGLGYCSKLAKSQHLQPYLGGQIVPAFDLEDTQRTKDWLRDEPVTMTQYHPIGTCAMGAVVDERLRVKGVRGLRVVDASVFPGHVSGNIQSSVYMLAEKAADMIKTEHGLAF